MKRTIQLLVSYETEDGWTKEEHRDDVRTILVDAGFGEDDDLRVEVIEPVQPTHRYLIVRES